MNKSNLPHNRFLFVTILIVTVILLVSFTISLFVVMANESGTSVSNDKNSGSGSKKDNNTPANVTVNENINTTPLYPTTPSRSSYIIGKSDKLVQLTDDSIIKSNNTILVELGSFSSIVEKNADQKIYPASMTKVMTLIVACERVTDLNVQLKVTEEVFNYAKNAGGSGFGLEAGDFITVKDALYLIGFESDTIASIMMANYIAGSEAEFVKLMNKKVSELGLSPSTHFSNCTGLHDENNYSTCRDIASIMAYALDNEMVCKTLSADKNTYAYNFKLNGNINAYAICGWYSERFNKSVKLESVTVSAGKTGYIDESGFSLVSYAVGNDGKKYINVIVGKPKGSGITSDISTGEVKMIYNKKEKIIEN